MLSYSKDHYHLSLRLAEHYIRMGLSSYLRLELRHKHHIHSFGLRMLSFTYANKLLLIWMVSFHCKNCIRFNIFDLTISWTNWALFLCKMTKRQTSGTISARSRPISAVWKRFLKCQRKNVLSPQHKVLWKQCVYIL